MTKIKIAKHESYSQSEVLALLKVCREYNKHLNLNIEFQVKSFMSKKNYDRVHLFQAFDRGRGFTFCWGEVPGKPLTQKLIKSFGSVECNAVGSLLTAFEIEAVKLAKGAIEFRKKEIETFQKLLML